MDNIRQIDEALDEDILIQEKFVRDDEIQRRRLQEYIFSLEEACETAEALSSENNQLKYLTEILLAVLEGSAHGIVFVRDHKFVWLNNGFTRMLGWGFEELGGFGLERLFPDEKEFDKIDDFVFSNLEKLGSLDWQYDFPHRDGHRVTCSLTGRLVNECDVSQGVVFTFIDITQKLRAEELLLQSERSKAMVELSNGVAHNFNNLLQIIMGNGELAKARVQSFSDPPIILQHLDQIIDSARYGSETVKRLQSFSSVRSENGLQSPSVLDLSEIAEHAVLMTRPLWHSGSQRDGFRISLVTEFGNTCFISGHKHEIFEVVINLIKNSIEAMPRGGELLVRTFSENGQVLLEIKDTGTGIKKEHLPKVFQPFWTTKGSIGTGMGLASSYGIVQRHGGTITIDSKYEQGTTVLLMFPKSVSEFVDNKTVGQTSATFDRNILLIDDVEPILESLKEMLTGVFQNILTAQSGEEGLKILESNDIDLIICDLGMPGINGIQVAGLVEEIFVKRVLERPKFIILTGWELQEQYGLSRNRAIDKVLQKPVSRDSLLNELDLLMRGRGC